jgi:hypothetical protein
MAQRQLLHAQVEAAKACDQKYPERDKGTKDPLNKNTGADAGKDDGDAEHSG